MNELALASFAAASDAHLVGEPRSARFAAFKARFDVRAELAVAERRAAQATRQEAARRPPAPQYVPAQNAAQQLAVQQAALHHRARAAAW